MSKSNVISNNKTVTLYFFISMFLIMFSATSFAKDKSFQEFYNSEMDKVNDEMKCVSDEMMEMRLAYNSNEKNNKCSERDIYSDNNECYKSPHKISDFGEAKYLIKKHKLYKDHQISFYCGCNYEYKKIKGNRKKPIEKAVVDAKSCGFVSKQGNNYDRAKYIEWEHVVPAHAFGQAFSCWRDGDSECTKKGKKTFKGRKCCEKVSNKFRAMESDLYNLQPAVGELNADRSNYSFGVVEGEPRLYGTCDFEISKEKINGKNSYKVEPKEDIRGDIARTYFYMQDTYKVNIISNKNKKLFESWDKSDPISKWECERARKIEKIQGNENPYLSVEKCKKAGFN